MNENINRNCTQKLTKKTPNQTKPKSANDKRKILEINQIYTKFLYTFKPQRCKDKSKVLSRYLFSILTIRIRVGYMRARFHLSNTVLVPLGIFRKKIYSCFNSNVNGGCVTTKTDRFSNICRSTCPIWTNHCTQSCFETTVIQTVIDLVLYFQILSSASRAHTRI